ncbi:POTRA domain-containing protein [Ulvibacterium sp.]|uniref:POTRA domain-containing protein n=1 Tax=Ulvibacterium sp. TaxID=2665914 RepID=UPI002615FB76|nr:POTRA domain-containing protein [Ulvibacterium sp.]
MRLFGAICFFLLGLHAFSQTTIVNIEIQGTKKTKPVFLKKLLQVQEGQELDSVVIEKDIQRLKRLPSISHADFEVIMGNSSQCDLRFTIEENFTLIPFANFYSTVNDELAFRLGLQEFNLLGRNITLGVFYQRDVFNSYGVNLRAPNLFGKRTGVSLTYQDFTTREPVFLSEGTADYRYNNRSFEALLLHEFNFKNRIEVGMNFFTEDYSYITGATSPNVPQDLVVDKYLYKLIYNFDALRYYYQYISGFRSILNFQYVRSQDQRLPGFWIGFNDFMFFKRVGKKGNWANRLRLGISDNVETPFAPFALDNNLNIRGVGILIDRGTGAIVLNTEFRQTLVEKDWFVLQGNVFVDSGSWRLPGGSFSDFVDYDNVRVYPGVGLRFIHKRIFNAIFRIDYGFGLITNDSSSGGIVFGIGQYF